MKHKLIFLLLSVVSLSAFAQPSNQDGRKLSMALYAISSLYVDSVNNTKLVEDAIRGMLDKLDPHSTYTDVEETKELTAPLQGNFDGIGIQFNMLTDTLYVIQVIPGGPSEKVGVMAGDRIIMVNDTVISGVDMKTSDIMSRLKGPKGSQVSVKVMRNNKPELIEFKIIRDKIPIHSLDAAFMVDKETGYLKLNRFAATTGDEIKDALADLKKQGMKNLILDLQGNGGGYLNAAIDLADEFLGNNELIVYTEGREQPREDANASSKGQFEQGKLIVLVDEGSASASEIVSGAIQDWDRGVIVGRRTFGKGLVQKPLPLPDGSLIRLTVARYYTPTGRSIQKPYVKGDSEDYMMDFNERFKHGEMMNKDSIKFSDSLRYETLKNKRTVYGGGGIMPDVFIPLDTTLFTNYHRNLLAQGLINREAMNVMDRSRNELKAAYKTSEAFAKDFEVNQAMLDDLLALAAAEKIEFNQEQYDKALPLIKLQIKALIARDLYDMGAYYEIINEVNDAYLKALQLIKDDKEYNAILNGKKTK